MSRFRLVPRHEIVVAERLPSLRLGPSVSRFARSVGVHEVCQVRAPQLVLPQRVVPADGRADQASPTQLDAGTPAMNCSTSPRISAALHADRPRDWLVDISQGAPRRSA